MNLCVSGVIDKTRYLVPYGGHTYEVDVFHGANEGLVLAEIELSDELEAFEKPFWLGEEVTGDVRYYNSMLSLHPFSK
jgi:CYTH domain-containing protein